MNYELMTSFAIMRKTCRKKHVFVGLLFGNRTSCRRKQDDHGGNYAEVECLRSKREGYGEKYKHDVMSL